MSRSRQVFYKKTGLPTEVGQEQPLPPDQFALLQNYPNPFNPVTTIRFTLTPYSRLPEGEGTGVRVVLKVFDLLGREVAALVNEKKPAGTHQVTWDASDMPSGVYFYRLTSGKSVSMRKMILLR
jgi:hypothetical protein